MTPGRRIKPGFALVITVSLLVLLTLIALGMLTLSTVQLRAAGQNAALATARANAKLAMMLAIGELQKDAGPDQRVTARADVVATNTVNPRLTGVWNSWNISATQPPAASDYAQSARNAKFIGWLVSGATPQSMNQVSYASSPLASPVSLWSSGSLGTGYTAGDVVSASKVPVSTASGSPGAYAWAAMDEGIKARIDTPYIDGTNPSIGQKTAQLGAGSCPNAASITSPSNPSITLSALKRSFFEQSSSQYASLGKGFSRLDFGLSANQVASGTGALLKPLTHDVSMSSAGLFTDTANGGLREDMHLLTNSSTLPTGYAGTGVYASRLGLSSANAPSDPLWDSLYQFSRVYRDKLTSAAGVPLLQAQVPNGWTAATYNGDPTLAATNPGTPVLAPPPGVVLMPTVAKVQVIFSLLARDIYDYNTFPYQITGAPTEINMHSPWAANFRGSAYNYLLHLQYTPVVTLYNPYNVALQFNSLKVVFGNVPFALQVWRNGVAQTTQPAPLDQMYYESSEMGTLSKRFGMTLYTADPGTETPGSPTFTLLPGEVKLFSPYIDPTRTWKQEESGTRLFSDFDQPTNPDSRTFSMKGIPGWRGDGIGFDLDWFCPAPYRVSSVENDPPSHLNMNRGGCIGLKRTDQFYLLFAPLNIPSLCNNKFTIEMLATPAGSSSVVTSGIIQMDYESPTGLQNYLLGPGGTLRYPQTGTVNTMDMLDWSHTPISAYTHVHPFAVVGAQGKTTWGGMDSSLDDGRLATKPWCFAHADIAATSQKIITEHPANESHEFDIQALYNGTSSVVQVDTQDRGNFITGLTPLNGVKFGVKYDIPLHPIQTLASLNGANPGGSSGYLPRFAQPIGNSWAHPLLPTTSITCTGLAGTYPYLDHSFLLNLALYDHYYFSGLADQIGPFGNGKTAATMASAFATGTPLDDARLMLYTPNGQAASALPGIISSPLPHTRIASWQMMRGAFNVNSTSVLAWKAMLASIHDAKSIYNLIDKTNNASSFNNLTPVSDTSTRISRLRLPDSQSAANGALPSDAYWMGPRELSDSDLTTLAQNIVKQIQARGPFLSVAEFVNRRLGTDDTAQRGALQQAIDNSNLNQTLANGANAGFEIPANAVTNYNYQNPTAGAGSSYQGAPGYLSQADILNVLGNTATVRSDTFTIRGYGEAHNAAGNTIATAMCEAIVQRLPDWVDPADKAEVAPASLTSTANKTFGRRFQIVSFRWLNQNEI